MSVLRMAGKALASRLLFRVSESRQRSASGNSETEAHETRGIYLDQLARQKLIRSTVTLYWVIRLLEDAYDISISETTWLEHCSYAYQTLKEKDRKDHG